MDETRPSEERANFTAAAARLEVELKRIIQGEVRFDAGSRALYSTDASNYRQVPIGVVIPRSREDIIETVRLCHHHKIPVLSRGAGTSLAGQCCNTAVILDLSKYMNRILEINHEQRTARVEPGVVLDSLCRAALPFGLTFGPDPATHERCTLGGMIGNDSCGVHSITTGRTAANVEELEVLTYDGHIMTTGKTSSADLAAIYEQGGRKAEIYRNLVSLSERCAELVRKKYPKIPRRASGYNLDELLPENGFHVARSLVGTEGTCIIVLSAVLRLVPLPKETVLLVLGFDDFYTAADSCERILKHGPAGLEGIDDIVVGSMRKKGMKPHGLKLLPEGKGWLLIEFTGDSKDDSARKAEAVVEELQQAGTAVYPVIYKSDEEQHLVWSVRESALGATAFSPGEPPSWPGWEDSAVHPSKLGPYLRDLGKLLEEFGYKAALYGHFGDGCVHARIGFDLQSDEGLHKYRAFIEKAVRLVVGYGGSLSGEHGDGQARGELLGRMFGPELVEAFREFKNIWDPDWKMNPGKVVDARSMTDDIRLMTPLKMELGTTHFQYPLEGDFYKATLRCVGVGKCRREEGGTMCPSYMVTREEKHSTRGRARLLYEMLTGDVLKRGWKEEAVKEALDLCLSCKGCKSDCPVQVDMATYKAEFMSHYYKGRRRPFRAYLFGWLYRWSPPASHIPWAVNFLSRFPLTGALGKKIAGIAKERELPVFAAKPFTRSFTPLKRAGAAKDVILWPDTFNNYFHPRILQSAAEVLRAFGYNVRLPPTKLCCGRTLYDYGMLDEAKKTLRNVLTSLAPDIEARVPVIGLEPGCISVFRDELINLFPEDDQARKLRSQFFTLSEFIERENLTLPRLNAKALVQPHCHHKAVMGFDSDRRVMEKLGLEVELASTGCCGMAGAFGFEADHFDVSVKTAERELVPRVNQADSEIYLVADGFSCREQIRQLTGRGPVKHLVELIHLALFSEP